MLHKSSVGEYPIPGELIQTLIDSSVLKKINHILLPRLPPSFSLWGEAGWRGRGGGRQVGVEESGEGNHSLNLCRRKSFAALLTLISIG